MDQGFASRGTERRVKRWMRTYRHPLAMLGTFLLVLGVFALAPDPSGSSPERSDAPAATVDDRPERSPCVACSLGKSCDPDTGVCEFTDVGEPDCVPGTEYDEDEGYCVPERTPEPTAPPTRTLRPGAPARTATPPPSVEPTDEPEPTSQPEPTADGPRSPRPPATPETSPDGG